VAEGGSDARWRTFRDPAMRNWNPKDVGGGLLFAAVGVFILSGALNMSIGTAQRMGPGYMPAIIGVTLIVLSLAVVWRGIRAGEPGGGSPIVVAWRPLAAVTMAIIAFGISIRWLGLVPAILLAVAISALGDRESRIMSTVVVGVVLALSAWLIFRVGLGLPMPAFRGWLQWRL
jgi:hypothetical protein